MMNEPVLMFYSNVVLKVLLFAGLLFFVCRGKSYKCPSCGKRIKLSSKEQDNFRFGSLRCPSCGCQFPADV